MNDKIIRGEPLGPRVISVKPVDDYGLFITFSNGEKRFFNAKPLLKLNAFKPLADKQYFETVKTAYGTIIWDNGIDYCPDTLYSESIPQN